MTKKWDEHMAIIMRLYKEQNIPLHEVQTIMEQKHNFKASWVTTPSFYKLAQVELPPDSHLSTRAYRSRFEKWGIHKYNCRRKGSSDGQVHALPAAPLEGGESTAAVTPPVSPGNSDQPGTRSGPSNGPFCGLESQIYPISPGYAS
ncbi:Clr5 domain-containing protein [Phialemonium atrogriseum]|uniref:Clr5 domain-containing protein n=1 Tax=Phialemonium atrogriseum TaxID=1093897 RepID=A0AAJ0CAS9_9PEZI|nr:Clr5 domain-containing protein [Phialemonium atrogriseum]KAK1771799.1 Clr5 domain-containing protein [Phialemonium atrogriseum]